jgi:hypothetical protein
MLYKELYAQLGKLLYAIADIDRKISPAEKEKLLTIIHDRLHGTTDNKDEYGSSVAYYPEFQFSYMEGEVMDAKTAFDDFLLFLEEHHTAIDAFTRRLCLDIARQMAEASYGVNKAEKALLDALKQKLNVLEWKELYPEKKDSME